MQNKIIFENNSIPTSKLTNLPTHVCSIKVHLNDDHLTTTSANFVVQRVFVEYNSLTQYWICHLISITVYMKTFLWKRMSICIWFNYRKRSLLMTTRFLSFTYLSNQLKTNIKLLLKVRIYKTFWQHFSCVLPIQQYFYHISQKQ